MRYVGSSGRRELALAPTPRFPAHLEKLLLKRFSLGAAVAAVEMLASCLRVSRWNGIGLRSIVVEVGSLLRTWRDVSLVALLQNMKLYTRSQIIMVTQSNWIVLLRTYCKDVQKAKTSN